jgi:HD-GYP domain-containing protein (c-di-GMP phosphodiesterase class II)
VGDSGRGIKILDEARKVIRPVSVSVIAIGILAVVMAFTGWQTVTSLLGCVLVVISAQMVYQVHRAVEHLKGQTHRLTRDATQAERHYVDVLWGMVRFAEARDKFTEGHSQRVAELSEKIARKLSLPPETCAAIKDAGRLHDLGMVAIPEKILMQYAHLGADDIETVKRHPEVAYEILAPLQSLTAALPAIRYHHERMNGTGYPDALVGEEIPMEARILAVADTYDAMTHDRPYRPAMSPAGALEELRRCAPDGYDPDCVAALMELKNLKRLRAALACA